MTDDALSGYIYRRSIRLPGYDYNQAGAYFVTICTQARKCLFGDIVDGEMKPSEYGQIVVECWDEIQRHFPYVELDAFVLMPNHVHGIIVITSHELTSKLQTTATTRPPAGAPNPLPGTTQPISGTLNVFARPTLPVAGEPNVLVRPTLPTVAATHASPVSRDKRSPGPMPKSLAAIVGSFKSAAAKRVNETRWSPGGAIWQRNYYEHVIRSEKSLDSLREYIANNILKWEIDQLHPDKLSKW